MSDVNTAAATTTEIKFKEDLLTTKAAIKSKFTSDATTGVATLPAGWAFDPEYTPEGVSEQSYTAHREHEDLLNNAATAAGSELAVELFKQNPELQTVTVSGPVNKRVNYEATFKREGTSRNVKTGEVSTYKGAIGVGRMNIQSSRTQAEWQNIKQNLRNMADAAGL